MYNHIGGKIKFLAHILCVVGFVFSGIVMISTWITGGWIGRYANGFTVFLAGLMIGVFGCLVAWAGSFFAYGFGQLLEDTHVIRKRLERADMERETEQDIHTERR